MTDTSGTVQVSAHKNDVNITQGEALRKASSQNNPSQSATVHEGQQATRDESTACGAALRREAASSGLSTKGLEIAGAVGVGGLVLCLLLCRNTGPRQREPFPTIKRPPLLI